MNNNYYEQFKTQKKEILELLDQSKVHFEQLNLNGWKKKALNAKERIKKDTFKVLVIGEFKRGKSTFINAMLGEEVLPAYSTPCTAVINEIKWDDKRKALLHFKDNIRDDQKSTFNDYFDEKITDHIDKYDGEIPPISIEVDELEKYIVIPDPAKDQKRSVAESPFKMVEIFWPFTIKEKGLKLIDSPGLNEHGTRTQVSLDYMSEADAIIFVMSSTALASQSEMKFINNNVLGSGHEDIFFVCNKFDVIRREQEKSRIKEYAFRVLEEKTRFGQEGIFFLSSILALDGRIDNDEDLLKESGLLELEEKLEHFLINERGKIKLTVPLKNIIQGITEIRQDIIPSRKKMLDQALQDIVKKYEKIKPQLEEKEHHRSQIIRNLENQFKSLENDLKYKMENIIKEIAENNFSDWAEQYEPKAEFKLLNKKSTTKEISAEIIEELSQKFEEKFQENIQHSITPFLQERIELIFENNRPDIKSFLNDIDLIRKDMFESDSPLEDSEDIPEWQRLAAAAGGLFIGGAGSALVGVALGPKEMMKSLIPNLAIGLGMIALGVVNPIFLIGALLGAGGLQVKFTKDTMVDKVKAEIALGVKKTVKTDADKNSVEAVNRISEKFNSLIENVDKGLDEEIDSIRQEVEAVITEKEKQESSIEKEKKDLEQISNALNSIQSKMNGMLVELNDDI